jgi:hypothetical protein
MFELTQYRRCAGCGLDLAGMEHCEDAPGQYLCNGCQITRRRRLAIDAYSEYSKLAETSTETDQ